MKKSRREFLKEAGLAASGIAIASLWDASCRRETTPAESTVSESPSPALSYYTPPEKLPPLLSVPGCTFQVAADRRYSLEHIWILPANPTTVVMGITEKMVTLFTGPYGIDLPRVGQAYNQGDTFGYVQGFKMTIDLICPITGTIVAVDKELLAQQVPFDEQPAEGKHIPSLVNDTYRSGWMVMAILSKPEEIDSLLTPEEYVTLCAKSVQV